MYLVVNHYISHIPGCTPVMPLYTTCLCIQLFFWSLNLVWERVCLIAAEVELTRFRECDASLAFASAKPAGFREE